ncbi:hypothetical protein MYP_2904 [Sporocytophaga myxococcoides]|uniref:Uncharacterized protein n=1 Tax=Sporocytophaga myxococcoides TaxID=153721 RepID=A0A098LFC1_9BACT|nr:hypothetical protein [Sporocytophaga myxococcoides]GAL85675.1 hypothetical protein MYP_2904 [Sporocytophaga myxococcoides]
MMIDLEKLKGIKLSDYIEEEYIEKSYEFEYATIMGLCQHIGHYIICFQSQLNPKENEVISFENVLDDAILKRITNQILKDIGLKLQLGQTFASILDYFGTEYSKDDYWEDIIRYHYFIQDSQEVFLSLGIHEKKGLCMVEIVTNPNIINGIKYEGWRC